MSHQYSLELISHEVDNTRIEQRSVDGFINATAMCRAVGKQFSDYEEAPQTAEFLHELSSSLRIPRHLLVFEQVSGPSDHRGTWVHPDVAINLGQWLSPKFAVIVAQWVREWMSGTRPEAANLPYHLKRYLANQSKVPITHFSILAEMTLGLIAPLEQKGYRLPDNMIPDISQGRMFAKWLRDEKGIETSSLPTYPHEYADGRVVDAKLYPVALLGDFRQHFHEVWMKTRCLDYFQERDSAALPHLVQVLGERVEAAKHLAQSSSAARKLPSSRAAKVPRRKPYGDDHK